MVRAERGLRSRFGHVGRHEAGARRAHATDVSQQRGPLGTFPHAGPGWRGVAWVRSLLGMKLVAGPVTEYVAVDAVLDFDDAEVAALARTQRAEHPGDIAFAAASFEYVRDQISHSWDVRDRRVTLSASETLREGVGLCFSKAHLLTAVLRAQGVPAGLCYQRLTDDGRRFDLHGLVAVYLGGAWHRLDPRGNKPGVDAQFSLDGERLAWQARPELGECDDPRVFARPYPAVVAALAGATDMLDLCEGGLPSEMDLVAPDDAR